MTITTYDTDEMVAIAAGLVKEGLTFTCRRSPSDANAWVFTLTGGY